MSRYSEEEMKILSDTVIKSNKKEGRYGRWNKKEVQFAWKVKEVEYKYSFFRRKHYKIFPVCQKILRLPLSRLSQYENDDNFRTIVLWRLFIAEPLDKMPLYINDELFSKYATNRIRTGK